MRCGRRWGCGYPTPAGADGAGAGRGRAKRRFLGRIKDGAYPASVTLTQVGANATVQVSFGEAKAPGNDVKTGGWVLTADDKMILGNGGMGAIGNAGHSNPFLMLTFENPGEIRAFICRIGDDVYLIKVQPRVAGLSNQAQFTFDELAAIPGAEAAAFETAGGNSANLLTVEQKAEIKALKDELSQMGVKVQWDGQQKCYRVPGK